MKNISNWMASLASLTSTSTSKDEKKRHRQRTRRKDANRFSEYATLEDRRLLADFYLDSNGSFFITGTFNNDVMSAIILGSNVQVTVNTETEQRPVAAVRELVFLPLGGDDYVANNTSTPSRMYGANGSDTLIGGWGDDRLVGNAGNDTLQGRDGNDIIRGSVDSNNIDGGNGNDFLYGAYGGKNFIRGGAGNDVIYAGDRGDEIHGDGGNDQLYGGVGDDLLFGEDGSNLIMGSQGNDSLYSDGSNSRLYGGTGNDGFFAGMGSGNQVFPGEGKDRILISHGQPVPQVAAEDAVIRFGNRSHNWNYLEIEAIDRGLRALHHRTNGTKVLKDSTSNEPMSIYKYQTNDPVLAGNDALNYHTISVTINPDGTRTETFGREIRVEDFDENVSHENRAVGLLVIHEFSHSWDSAYEIGRNVSANSVWSGFLALSGWTNQNPNSSSYTRGPVNTQEVFEYEVVNGQLQIPIREWWYLSNSAFARSYGTNNAKEDWGVSWEAAFVEEVYGPATGLGLSPVPAKVAKINELLSVMG